MSQASTTLPEPLTRDDVAGVKHAVVKTWSRVALYVAVAELVALYASTVAWLFDRWTLSVWHHAHGLVIPPVVAYFIYRELRPLASAPRRSNAWGFLLLVPALALRALDAGMHTELLSAVSLLIALPGLSLLFLGTTRTRAIMFPLAFLAFALPLPLVLTEPIHWQLRQFVTAATASVMPLLGIPVLVEGTTLHLAHSSLQVADACSGFSTLYAAFAVAALSAHSATTSSRRVAVLLAAAPVAMAANVLRVVLLVVLVAWQGEVILTTPLHPLSGVLTFAIALPLLLWIGSEPRETTA